MDADLTHGDKDGLAKRNLESFRETFRTAPRFSCACCGLAKDRKEGAGVRNYDPGPGPLASRMVAPAAYALCLECVELPEPVIQQKVTAYLATQGLFK